MRNCKQNPDKIVKTFKYRIYPNKGTKRRTIKTMRVCAAIYNIANQERKQTYEESKTDKDKKPVNSYRKQYPLIRKRDHPEYARYDAQMLQNVLISLDADWKGFFSSNKNGDEEAHPPGEKKIHRNLSFRQSGRVRKGNRIFLRYLGGFKMRMHRPIEGKIKTAGVTVKNGKWYICFSCEIGKAKPKKPERKVKISFPKNLFLRDSAGLEVEHAEFYFKEIATLRRLSKSLSKKKKGSRNRRKAKYTLAKWQERIANKRKYFLQQLVAYYTSNYDEITVPKLPLKYQIEYATTSRRAMKLCDSSYGMFVNMLKQKCNEYGISLIERKDEQWQIQIEKAEQVAQLEHAQKFLRKAKKTMKVQNPGRLRFLERDLKRVPTLQS